MGIFDVGDFIFVVITFIIVIAIAIALVYYGVKIYRSFMKHNSWGHIKRRESRNEVLAFCFFANTLLKRVRMQLMLTSKHTMIQAQDPGFNHSMLRNRITRCFSHSAFYHPILPVSFGMVTSPFSTAVKASSRTWSAWSSCSLGMTSGGWKRKILPARVIITTPCANA